MSLSKGVAALILEYRSPEKTVACVRSILEDGVREILVIDNSDDGGLTFRQLNSSIGSLEGVRIHCASGNHGFAAGVNLGLRMIEARRVLLINNDAIAMPGLTKYLCKAIESSLDTTIAYPKLVHAGRLMQEVYYHRWFATISPVPGMGKFKLPRGCCMMIATDRLPPGPLFDEAFFMYGEEIELGWRIQRLGGRITFVPEAAVEHEGSGASIVGSLFYEFHTARAHLLLGDKLSRNRVERGLLAMVRLPSLVMRAFLRAMKAKRLVPLTALVMAARAVWSTGPWPRWG